MIVRKIPVEVEAVLWTGKNHAEIFNFIGKGVPSDEEGNLFIPTLEGTHRANPGNWIIKGVKGEIYPIKDNIFKETYEFV